MNGGFNLKGDKNLSKSFTKLTEQCFSLTDEIEMGLFVFRYLSTLCIFVLGLKAPGIMQSSEYFSLNDATRNFTPSVSFLCDYIIYFLILFSVL